MVKNQHPLISIVIPVHNNETTVGEALDSALAQTYAHLEVVVVNDFSTDDSCAVVDRIAEKDGRITRINNVNPGVSAARNAGLKHCGGEFVVFLDADDKLMDTYLEKGLECYASDEDLTIVYSNMERFEREIGLQELDEFAMPSFLRRNCIPIFAMVRTTQLVSIGGFDETMNLCEDWECWMHLLKIFGGGVYRIEQPQYFYRKRFSNDSLIDVQLNKEGRFKEAALYIFAKHQDLYEANDLSLQFMFHSLDEYKLLKRKYYGTWYRKLSYKLFKPKKYAKIYDNLS